MSSINSKKGIFILILGPSGSGKGTVLSYFKRKYSDFVFPISCTTRAMRPREIEGQVYNFVTKSEFLERIDSGDFLEYAIVHSDNYYGTLKEPIMKALDAGKVVVREVDVQGARAIKSILKDYNVKTIFLSSPWEDLKKRITKRAPISDDELSKRHESFVKEMEWKNECDYAIESREGQINAVFTQVDEIILSLLK